MDRRKIAEEIERLAADLKSARIDADDLLAGLAAVSEVVTNSTRASAAGNQVVTPWAVAAKPGQIIDYEKLINEFGCQRIDRNLIDQISRLTNQPAHALLRRGVFFAHRELDQLLDAYKNGDKFYVYTGRGPSSGSLHLGHLIPFMFTRYLQEAFKVPVVIQLTDDEKFLCRPELSVEQCMRFARENVKDIIACGFDLSKTFIFSNFKKSTFGDGFFLTQTSIQKHVNNGKASSIFGFTSKDNIGKNAFPASQAAPSFSATFPHIFSGEKNLRCLIPCAVDQDPYFRMTRAVAPKLEFKKPSLIESKFLPALQGLDGKMGASDPHSAIFLDDDEKKIKKTIYKAFSGGRDNVEEHRELGANLEVDVPIKYLEFFLEDDDELELIKTEYGAGRMLTGEVKKRLIEVLTDVVQRHQKAREAVTDEMVDAFMAVRPLPNMFR